MNVYIFKISSTLLVILHCQGLTYTDFKHTVMIIRHFFV